MIIAAPHFFDVSIKERRLIFVIKSEKSDDLVSTQDTNINVSDKFDRYSAELVYNALEEFLVKNPEISDSFKTSEHKSPENSLGERAFQDLHEKLIRFMDDKKKSGIKISRNWEKDVADLMAETVCKVLYLESMKNVDPLTGLPDRRAFEMRLKEEIANSSRSHPFCLLIFDLDKFKNVNDTFGHLAGDDVLRELARCFRAEEEDKRILRESDFVGRYGSGDEIVILTPNTNKHGGCIVANRISAFIKGKPFKVGENGNAQEIYLTASIGVSQYQGRSKDPHGKKMISQADHFVYIMKGKRPDRNGLKVERRGSIACNGRIIGDDEMIRILEKNPHLLLPIDRTLISRQKVMSV